jgi:hypothetical protein
MPHQWQTHIQSLIRGGAELKECRSDRSIAHCGGAGGRGRDKARRGCTRSHALPFSRDTSPSSTQERKRERECAKVQYSTVQQSLTWSVSEMASCVELPVHIAFPASLKAILLEIGAMAASSDAAIAMQLSIRSLAQKQKCSRTRLQVPPHLSHRSVFEDL